MKNHPLIVLVIVLMTVACSQPASAGSGEEIFLSESPPRGHSHGKSRGGEQGHSEHRAAPVKKFYLNTHAISDNAAAYVLRPDGTMTKGTLSHGEDGWSVTFDTRPLDSSMDGVFNVYIVDREVVDQTLLLKVAKMNMINHSCDWGHKYKYDTERLTPKSINEIPLEITAGGLWDGYFHTKTMSGDTLTFTVLHEGKAVEGAKVKVSTQTGWTKELKTDSRGKGTFQLIRDYYPESWDDFNSRKRGNFLVTAEYELAESGEYSGNQYNKVRLITTFPWKYNPQRNEYTSYAYGISVATVFACVTGFGIFLHRERRKRRYREADLDEKA
ncbi:MAG: hypothetical protein OEW04_07540 [Nitrospirota bacterium]|nr:hypothetical protein [Nitrospirota bacterium]